MEVRDAWEESAKEGIADITFEIMPESWSSLIVFCESEDHGFMPCPVLGFYEAGGTDALDEFFPEAESFAKEIGMDLNTIFDTNSEGIYTLKRGWYLEIGILDYLPIPITQKVTGWAYLPRPVAGVDAKIWFNQSRS